MERLTKILQIVSRLIIGATFIFSGFVKMIDPVGTSIKFQDYFEAMHLGFLVPNALVFAILLACVEFLLGVNVLLALSPRHTSWYVLIFMSFMTLLTLYLALGNPVSDCGCFGDAVKLTNWQTFGKNIVLMAFTLFYFYNRKNIPYLYHEHFHWLPSLITFVFGVAVVLHCYFHLPIIDFLPYKLGTNIQKGMEIPVGAAADVYETTFIYQKGGEKKEFTLQNYPANDTTWHFVEQKSVLKTKGYEPPIHDFSLLDKTTGEDITDVVLQDTSFTFLLISPKLEKAVDAHIDQINNIYDYSQDKGYKFYCMTSSVNSEIENWINATGAEYPFTLTDETALKTIIRANPGMVLLKNGTVVGKWNSGDIPDEKAMSEYIAKVNKGTVLKETDPNVSIIWKAFIGYGLILALLLAFEKTVMAMIDAVKRFFSFKNKEKKKKEIVHDPHENPADYKELDS
ncbi:MAG: DoxX family protein [Bacteroidota bacterium]|nr:DoxX family protein [Bacteroidota bacterium]